MTINECYKILGVSPQASQEEIKIAYQKLIRQWHPDVNKDPKAEEKTKKINEAYEILRSRPFYPKSPWDTLWPESLFDSFKTDPFTNFNSKITKASVVLEIDGSNNKDINSIPEILKKAGFKIKQVTITRYHQ